MVEGTRKRIRTAIRGVLADSTNGFSAKFSALMADYGLTEPVNIDWGPDSDNVFEGYIEPGMMPVSQVADYPAILIYTTDSAPNSASRMQSEVIDASLVFVVKHSARLDENESIEQDDTESELDAIEHAAKQALRGPAVPWQTAYGVIFANEISASRSPLVLYEDGWEQWLFLNLTFEVDFSE